jgi:EAL domain-containing protein (putative c-di-GMP-specific phosphodiesterase class I)
MQLLKTLGCDEGQGYFFSRPVPPEEIQPFSVPEFQRAGSPKS